MGRAGKHDGPSGELTLERVKRCTKSSPIVTEWIRANQKRVFAGEMSHADYFARLATVREIAGNGLPVKMRSSTTVSSNLALLSYLECEVGTWRQALSASH